MRTLKKILITRLVQNSAAQAVALVVQTVTSIALARMLTSADFGIVAFAAVFVNLLSQFSDVGITSALIYWKNINSRVVNTAFAFRNIVNILLVTVAVGISFIIPYFSDMPNLDWVIRCLALNFVINSIGFIPGALLKRDLDFVRYNVAQLISVVIGSGTAIWMALSGLGYWSLVFSSIASAIFFALIVNLLRPTKQRFAIDRTIGKEFWRYGSKLLYGGICIYIVSSAGNLFVGMMKGADALGFYLIALNWGTRVPNLLSLTVLSVLFPAFARIRDDTEQLASTYLNVLRYVSGLSIMVNGTLLFISEDFLVTILGGGTEKWLPALVVFKIFCIHGIFRAVLEPAGQVVMALGDTRILLRANLIAAGAQVLLMYPVVVYGGIEGAGALLLVSYLLQFPIFFRYMIGGKGILPSELLGAVAIPILSSVAIVAVYCALDDSYFEASFSGVILQAAIYCGAYLVAFAFLTEISRRVISHKLIDDK